MSRNQTYRFFEVSSVLLFFIQALKVMFSVLFGIIYDGVFEGPFTIWLVISVVLLILVFLFPALFSTYLRRQHLRILALVTAAARVALCFNGAEIRYWGSLVTLLAGALYLVGSLCYQRQYTTMGFLSALSLDQIFRILGYTYDISLRLEWVLVQVLWVVLLFAGGTRLKREDEELGVGNGLRIKSGLALGGFLFLQTSLLSLPNGVARWSSVQYEWIAPVLLFLTLLFLHPTISHGLDHLLGSRTWIRPISAVILLLGLMLGYFYSGILAVISLFLAYIASISLLFTFLRADESTRPRTGSSVAVALVLFLLLNFLNAFAFTYPYTLPALREMGWVVYLAAGIFLGLATFQKITLEAESEFRFPSKVINAMLVLWIVVSVFLWPRKASELSTSGTIRVATYNIHYGYDDDWHFTLDKIAETIEENDCDVVAMQEVDTGRMTSYLVDDAHYLARTLKMNVAYLPTVEHLTGIGILYRGPKVVEESQLLSSLQEQTGIIGLRLGDSNIPLYVYGTWLGLGNEDTELQIREALSFIGDRSLATFGGDFNADPESPVAQVIREDDFEDPFTLLEIIPAPFTSPAIQPRHRIDFVWLRGLRAVDAWVPESLASDHRMVVVEVEYRP